MKVDEYGVVSNALSTYMTIGLVLLEEKRLLIAWTDEHGTQFDILFVYQSPTQGPIQRGIRSDDLFVSIMGLGSHGFTIQDCNTHWRYIAGKLNVTSGITARALGTLINGVKHVLQESKKL